MARKTPPVWVAINGKDNISKVISKVQGKLGNLQRKTGKIGRDFSTKFSLPLAGVGLISAKLALDLNKDMGNIQSLLSGTVDETTARVQELKKSFQDTSKQTGVSTGEIAAGAYQVISAFGDMKGQTEATMGTMARMAVAGQATVVDSINLTSAVTKAYGDTSVEAQKKVADLAFTTVKLGQTTFPELAASIGKVAPMAAVLNVKQEELFATMATATGVTGQASEVATQLRGVLASLAKPTETMGYLLQKHGVKTGEEFIKKAGGLQGAINLIVAEAKAANVPLGDLLGSVEGQTIAMVLAGGQAQNFTDKLNSMAGATGAMDDAFKKQSEGINKTGHEIELMKASLITTAQAIGDKLIPVAASLLQNYVMPLANWISNLSPATIGWAIAIGGLVAAVGPALMMFSNFVMVLKGLIFMLRGVVLIMNILRIVFLTNPIGLIITAVALLVAGIVLLIKNWDWVVAKFKKAGQFFKGIFGFGPPEGEGGATAAADAPASAVANIEKRAGATPGQTVNRNATVKVKFDNAPKGTRVTGTAESDLDLETDLGFANGG